MRIIDRFKLQLQLRADAHFGQTPIQARQCEHCTTLDDALMDWWTAHDAADEQADEQAEKERTAE